MKNNLLRIVSRGWQFSLVLMALSMLFMAHAVGARAEPPAASEKAKELATNAPKTPEAFLYLVKAWRDDPHMDGYDFAEKIIGVEREDWGPSELIGGHRAYSPEYYMKNNGITPPILCQINSIQIAYPNNHIWDTIVYFNRESLCVNAALVQEILGKPSSIKIKMPNKYNETISNYSPLIHFTYQANISKIVFKYGFDESQYGNILDLPIEKQNEIYSYITKESNYKYLCAKSVRFGAYD